MHECSVCENKGWKQVLRWVNCIPDISPVDLSLVSVSGSVCLSVTFKCRCRFLKLVSGSLCLQASSDPYAYSSVSGVVCLSSGLLSSCFSLATLVR